MPRCRLLPWSRGQQIGVGNQAAGCARVIEHNKKAAAAIFHEVQGRNEQHFCQFGITQTLLPKTIFFDGICDPPAPIQKSKYLHSVCKYFHLSSRRENEADMTAAKRRSTMCLITRRTRNRKRKGQVKFGPLLNINNVDEEPVLIHQRESVQAIGEPMETTCAREG